MCRDEKEKNPGLNRDQVSTAKARVSRGCSATPLAARRETNGCGNSNYRRDRPTGSRGTKGWECAHTSGLRSFSTGQKQVPVPKPRSRLVPSLARQKSSEPQNRLS